MSRMASVVCVSTVSMRPVTNSRLGSTFSIIISGLTMALSLRTACSTLWSFMLARGFIWVVPGRFGDRSVVLGRNRLRRSGWVVRRLRSGWAWIEDVN